MNTTPLKAFCVAVALVSTAMAEDLITTTPATAKDNVVGISARDGITISETGALFTRNGVTKQVSEPMKLGNGAKVSPDGTVLNADGTHLTLRPGQILTFDGQLINPDAAAPVAPSTTTVTTTTEK